MSDKKPSSRSDKSQRTGEISRQVLDRIEQLGLKPIPRVYELWFRYFQADPEIVRAIDAHQGPLDEISCHKFYKRYLSETAVDDAIKKISDQLHQAINDIAAMMNSVRLATSEYGDTLVEVKEEIENAETLESLSGVISDIVEYTKMMVQKNQKLEVQLTSSLIQVADLRKSLDNVKKESMTDDLTGLANRKAFDKQIHDWVEETSILGGDLCLLMLDIDHFKEFNDTYGHQTGDQILRLVARTLTDGVKGRDLTARFGGEEFAIILPETSLQDSIKLAETLRRSLENKEVINRITNKNLGRITLSIGVAQYIIGESVTDFIERADAAMYEAKKAGRNQVRAAAAPAP
jgi:diguanylate cyclase